MRGGVQGNVHCDGGPYAHRFGERKQEDATKQELVAKQVHRPSQQVQHVDAPVPRCGSVLGVVDQVFGLAGRKRGEGHHEGTQSHRPRQGIQRRLRNHGQPVIGQPHFRDEGHAHRQGHQSHGDKTCEFDGKNVTCGRFIAFVRPLKTRLELGRNGREPVRDKAHQRGHNGHEDPRGVVGPCRVDRKGVELVNHGIMLCSRNHVTQSSTACSSPVWGSSSSRCALDESK